ncbi:uncharacterized protein Z520_11530 [Fonsecaea multimorphosa CBS 102226]|uniref:Sulfite oxidase n=1 Tax=Fonsecaea multimorphosa CBS 102226 TaxID=1442371 RepID=A0A0D2K8K3_9EURO|nr:uncharacterized protein Z520_11530 [Fonsecaea multimorphosa CBS 102226]KIX92678.1 hypothetical protein Z520_11530 [Fonsecaea multimorphosa CBS 102226]OAL18009.1 hypothetical protein AYO22_11077 [Fonsecaea multimorphosa]
MNPGEDGSAQKPVNREPDTSRLVQSFLTPSQSNPQPEHTSKSQSQSQGKPQLVAYDRNHGPIQHLDGSSHRLSIKSDPVLSSSSSPNSNTNILPQPLNAVLSLSELSDNFEQVSITCALQCAGNRRHEMRERLGEVSGLDWGDGAVMNAEWRGVRVRDVLVHAGLKALATRKPHDDGGGGGGGGEELGSRYEGLHVQFACTTQPTQEDDYYGSSVPLSIALDPDRECLLATHMNGEVLPARHGFPLRAIVPGVIGARSVKWLDSLVVAGEESTNHYQRRDYKILPPEVDSAEEAKQGGDELWDSVEAMMDNPINSVVAVPGKDDEEVQRDENGRVHVRGYAIPKGKDGPVVKVEVSLDRGHTWHEASILDQGDEFNTHPRNMGRSTSTSERGQFAWVLWDVHVPCAPGEDISIWSKATDRGGNTMSVEQAEGSWNLRGVGFNAVEGRRGIKVV